MPASEAGVKRFWRCENCDSEGRVITVNDIHMCETGHNMHAPSPQKTAVKNRMTHLKDATASSQDVPSRLINKELQSNLPKVNSQKLSKA